jgi:hypothetical protein
MVKLRQRQELLLVKIWTRAHARKKFRKPDGHGELLFAVAAMVDVVASIVGLLGRPNYSPTQTRRTDRVPAADEGGNGEIRAMSMSIEQPTLALGCLSGPGEVHLRTHAQWRGCPRQPATHAFVSEHRVRP